MCKALKTFVDLQFRLQGDVIPADHGYLLFSAISRIVPKLHGNQDIGIHPVSGILSGNRTLTLTRNSYLTIRTPSELVGTLLRLAGETLSMNGARIHVGVPRTQALMISRNLYSRLVVIKGFTEPDPFLEAVQRQLDTMKIQAKFALVSQPHIAMQNRGKKTGTKSEYLRRTLRIRGKEIVGFAVRIEGISPPDSIKLQQIGVGGRRRFGCGIFIPDRT